MEVLKLEGHDFFTINNGKNLEIEFCQYGASIYSIKYKNKVVSYHPEDRKAFLSTGKYSGKMVGRTCGRLADAIIEVNNTKYQLDMNEKDKSNCLHGGKDGISFKDFSYEVVDKDEQIDVIFKCTSPANEGGYPAKVDYVITYEISKTKDKFIIHMVATPDGLTTINMTTHIYWRLGGSDILDHTMYVDASKKMHGDLHRMFNINPEPVSPWFDFNQPKKISKDILEIAKVEPCTRGYDHMFIFNKPNDGIVKLQYDHTTLTVKTDMPAANIYANCWESEGMMLGYEIDKRYGGIAIEPQLAYTSYKDLITDKPFNHFISFELE